MLIRQIRTFRGALIALAVLGVIAGGTGAAIVAAQSPAPPHPQSPADLPHPVFNKWINLNGVFWVGGPWDDRFSSSEQKAALPWYDPRWRPFGQCMSGKGFEIRTDTSKPVGQRDIDGLLARVNASRPDKASNKLIADGEYCVGGLAGAFLECADRWLAMAPEDLAKNGLRMLDPGGIPAP